ncbi:sulfotransferase domain-containing protein [Sulfurimonas hydrogeniphila]|uniref:sulfotransferase domain-containing protein n=1 Tax=Sulfurimonas TaxID=202746 RepID=UPI00125EC553|nr:sulfotransferase domain-containing protein [Sulfurimonas hydrogeniphila]
MKMYNHNILISSMPKSGTVLVTNIIYKLLSIDKMDPPLNEELLEAFLKKLNIKDTRVSFGGINSVNNKEILVATNFHNLNGTIYKHFLLDITNGIDLSKKVIYFGHASPIEIMSNKILKKINKKIYVYRYGLDVLNSKMKFIENLDYVFFLMKKLKSQLKYQELRYLTPEKVYATIEAWTKHVEAFLKYKKEFYGIQYESLLANPRKEIKKLSIYLEIDIDDEKIENIIDNIFYKELTTSIHRHAYYRHYNESKKVKEWFKFISYKFYKDFVETNKNILQDLGYSISLEKKYNTLQFHNIFERKLEVYKRIIPKFQSIKNLVEYLKGYNIVVYGYNNYKTYLKRYLKNNVNVTMICDNNFKNINKEHVLSPKKLLSKVSEYDYIIITESSENCKVTINKKLRLHGGVVVLDVCHLIKR